MPSNWPGWAKLYVGSSTAPQTPVNQEKVARGQGHGPLRTGSTTWPNVAHWWLTGSGDRNQALWSTYSRDVRREDHEASTSTSPRRPPPPTPWPSPRHRPRRRSAGRGGRAAGSARTTSASPTPGAGTTARHTGYSGQTVLYSQTDGATATYPFYGEDVAWVGPVGPTRGTAQVAIDGTSSASVDLRRSSVRAEGSALRAVVQARRQPHADDHGRRQRPAGRDRRVRRHALIVGSSSAAEPAAAAPPARRRSAAGSSLRA